MHQRNRPSALDVSFRDGTHYIPVKSSALPPPPPPPRSQASKRKFKGNDREHTPKKAKLPPVCYFQLPTTDFAEESADLAIAGEDEDDEDEGKPTRNLWDFTIYDSNHKDQYISLSSFENPDGADCTFKAFGNVTAFVENEEDEGQEADLPDVIQPILLSPILSVALDYTKRYAPVYIETRYAWYILQIPSLKYKDFLRHFYLPHHIAQMLVASALEDSRLSREKFEKYLERAPAFLDRQFSKEDLMNAAFVIYDVVKDVCKKHPALLNVPIIKNQYLRSFPTHSSLPPDQRRRGLTGKSPLNRRSTNPDLAVLQNQIQTTVTPKIGQLAQRYFREGLRIVGPPRKVSSAEERRKEKAAMEITLEKLRKELRDVVKNCHENGKARWNYRKEDQYWRGSKWVKAITIDGVVYEIGDTVLVPIGDDPTEPSKGKGRGKEKEKEIKSLPSPTTIPPDQSFSDFFWFARIINIDIDSQVLHIQWFNHGNATVMGDIAHPQELFLQALCGPVLFDSVAAKVKVHYLKPKRHIGGKAKSMRFESTECIPLREYFCKSEYEPRTAHFSTIRREFFNAGSTTTKKPDNCPVCDLVAEHKLMQQPESLKDYEGVSFHGTEYHVSDFVLYQSELTDGPGSIGQIVKFEFPLRESSNDPLVIVVRKLGRLTSLKAILPEDEFADERELFCTEETARNQEWIHATSLIQLCYVVVAKERSSNIENWILHSHCHFYVRFRFPSLENNTWEARKAMRHKQLSICRKCYERCGEEAVQLNQYILQTKPLRALDVFGGGGAFGMALSDGSANFDVAHAIEIAPSAAQTYRMNSPQTQVHNICVNEAVRQIGRREISKQNPSVKYSEDLPKDRTTGEPVEFSLEPGDIDVIVAGFPCQPHSNQNMFKSANDGKTNLILPLLSIVDLLRPVLLVFENVYGFVSCRLMAKQVSQHIIEGGFKQGALKLLIRALIDMGYQVRFSLIQAGHYGTPQGRVRFFLVASLPGTPLPELPQPTHDFPLEGVAPHLRINLENGRTIEPIQTARGRALFPFVTIDDAIGDLRLFDWKHPSPNILTGKQKQEALQRKANIPSVPCRIHLPHWGLPEGDHPYERLPRSRFQLRARAKPLLQNIQHYTRLFPPKTVERVLHVPLAAGSDHRSLPLHLGEYQSVNPEANAMKSRSKKSMYKRLDPDRYFMTTVTNISPTAKQSSVLNPWCYRILTVRELARSQGFPDHFSFFARKDDVITMHRCIGNAVPWQLSLALGEEIKIALFKQWKDKDRDKIIID